MGLAERRRLYTELEQARGRPLITYVTSPRPGQQAMMAADAIPEVLDQLSSLPTDTTKIDVLIVSNGGDPTVAWRMMSLLRDRLQQVSVLVPQAAFSAATLLALGADEIVMHPHGNLGPVDAQISVRRRGAGPQDFEEKRFGSEDLTGFLAFAREEVGLTDQQYLSSVFKAFCNEVGATTVGTAARGARLSLSLGEKLLLMHMKDDADAQKARGIAEALNKEFFHHGYPVGRVEARKLGLKVPEKNDPEVERLMWAIWKDIEGEMRVREQFTLTGELSSNPGAAALFGPIPQLNIPATLPPQVLNQILGQVLQAVSVQPVDFEILAAVVESTRLASRFVSRGKILATRMPDMQLAVNPVPTRTGWETVP